jgi:hypothetical protein
MLLAEFAYNNSVTSAHRMTPFYANYGYHPYTGTVPIETNTLSVSSVAYRHWTFAVFEDCKKELETSSKRMKKYADQHHLGKVLYVVKWKGWPAKKHWTRESLDRFYIVSTKAELGVFRSKNPKAPRDSPLTNTKSVFSHSVFLIHKTRVGYRGWRTTANKLQII